MLSLSRQLAQWVVSLRYDSLPPEVVDRVKGVTLHNVSSALLGARTQAGEQAVKLVVEEEAGVKNGATIMVFGHKVTKAGAGFANSEMNFAGGKWDTFRMLTHPGTSIIPGALAVAETRSSSGRDYVTAVAAAYEVMERLASEYIPSLMARGFHPSPVFGIFGPAIAAAKLLDFNEDQVNSVIALAASLASGNIEGARSGGKALREGAAVRNAMLAVALAGEGHVGGDTVLEGEAGFYHAHLGNNQGRLAYSFSGRTHAPLEEITAGLGKDWMFLETLYRIYSTSGYNIAHIDVTAALCEEHDIRPDNVERVEALVNWLETQYPSPAFPVRREDQIVKPGSTAYHTAYAVLKRGFPMLRAWSPQSVAADDPPEVTDMMKRVKIIPAIGIPLFGPRITIFTKDGKSYTKAGTGREFIWDFEEESRRIRGIVPGLPIPAAQFEQLIHACRALETLPRADELVKLTLKS